MKRAKKIAAVVVAIVLAVGLIPAVSSTGRTEAASTFQITSPTDNQLLAAGYMDITWDAPSGSVKEYRVYIDGSKVATTTSTTYEYYTTKVESFTVYVEALFSDNSTQTTDTITFGVTKKGLGLSTDMGANLDTKYMGIGWYYNWGTSQSSGSQYEGIEYVPMIWGGGSVNSSDLNRAKNADSKYVLGFNEPDLGDQSNMSVSTVINYWPQLMNIGKRLGSPAASTWPSANSWFQNFMTQVNSSSSLDVDFITIHCYPDNWAGSSMAEWFLTDVVDAAYEMYHKPIWITEFSTVGNDVSATGGNGTKEFWETVMPGLDEREYVERYAAFGFNSDSCGLWRYSSGELTPAGEVYASLGNPEGFTPEYAESDYTVSIGTRTTLLDDSVTINNVTCEDYVNASGVSATASSEIDGNVASNAIDNDVSSRWESEQGVDPQYITIDLGTVRNIKQISIIWEAASAAEYTIEVSDDGKTYTTVATVTSSSQEDYRLDTIVLNEMVSGRYVRIYGTSRTMPYGYSIRDIGIYGTTDTKVDETTTAAPKTTTAAATTAAATTAATTATATTAQDSANKNEGSISGDLSLSDANGEVSGADAQNDSSSVKGATSSSTAEKLSKIKIKKAKRKSAKKAKIKIKKVAGASGYIVRYCTNKKFKGYTQKKTTKRKITLKKLEAGKKYFVKARAYQIVSGKKVKGAWSKVKKIKAKK